MNKQEIIDALLVQGNGKYNIIKIEEYVEFCMIHNNIKNNVQHHILPKCVNFFPQYKNLYDYPWNTSILSYEHHAAAHKLLYKATLHYKMAYAYINTLISLDNTANSEFEKIRLKSWQQWANDINSDGIRNIDVANAKSIITKTNTILPNGLSILEDIGRKCKDWQMQEIILPNGERTTNQKEVVKRSIATKLNTINNLGQNQFQQHSEFMKNTMAVEIKDKTGEQTTVGKLRIAKAASVLAHHLDKKIVNYNGIDMTLREMKSAKMKYIKNKGRPKFRIIGNGAPANMMFLADIKKISSALSKTSKHRPMGGSAKSINQLKAHNLLHMIGWYIQEIPNDLDISNDS